MAPKADGGARAALLGDVVGSRTADDRKALHDVLTAALAEVTAEVDALDDIQVTAGDEFQGTFATVGEAVHAALLLRLRLSAQIDIRVGIGWGDVTVLDAARSTQDGPAWWAARAAIDWVEAQQGVAGFGSLRTAYRRAEESVGGGRRVSGPAPDAINAALLCQDHLIGSMDERSRHILEGLMHGRTQASLADELGLTRQAVNQRRKHDGLAVVAMAAESLRMVR